MAIHRPPQALVLPLSGRMCSLLHRFNTPYTAASKKSGYSNCCDPDYWSDIEQILMEAQHRWLRPAEICEILRNYNKFRIAPEPANMPPSGSLFLFDRKVLRYFRKDGHNWRKKKDGKTVKEAHERLKAGSIDVLHCYYAHGEENENFQRRSYWLLEEELSHIVLVHYREVKGHRANYNRIKEAEEAIPNSQESEEVVSTSEVYSSVSSKFNPHSYQVASQNTDTSLNSPQVSEYEDAESAYNHQVSSGFHSFLDLQPRGMEKIEDGLSVPYYPVPFSNDFQGKLPAISGVDFDPLVKGDKGKNSVHAALTYPSQKHLDLSSWEDVFENSSAGLESVPFQPSLSSHRHDAMSFNPGDGNELLGAFFADGFAKQVEVRSYPHLQDEWQPTCAEDGSALKSELECNSTVEGKAEPSPLKQPHLDGVRKQELKKLDSFDKWMSKELGDVNESHVQSSSGTYWETVEAEDGVDDSSISPQEDLDPYMLGPSLSLDQLFSIIDFSPNWAYAGSEIKVLITGRFLMSQHEVENCKWSCMFGEVEVPVEIIADGVLRCHTPLHKAGRVPFYVTCSNRLACSEVREFEYRVNNNIQDVDILDIYCGSTNEILLRMRFGKLLSLESASPPSYTVENSHLSSKISSLLKEDSNEWEQMLMLTSEQEFSAEKVKERMLQKLLKEKLHVWLLQKVAEGGKGPSVLDEEGQGVLHFAAALGYDWAIPPTLACGVSVNFRDVNGWTALHWAASCGRERTVGFLMSHGADPGALTDPNPMYPSGQTAADLASSKGHKGIAGYLAESALSSHLTTLQLKDNIEGDAVDISGIKAVQTVSERTATPTSGGDMAHGSLKDSLAAVVNAAQAAARIHQVFRVQSFQRKQLKEYDENKLGMSDERALSLVALRTSRLGHDEPAHVRGHQVRKNYRKITWSVGIVEKVILRWRRKGSGLRGFKQEALAQGSSRQDTSSTEDDYDFLKEGRKQTEERLQKALARVKSMVQYPEARDQYRRLLNVVTEIQGTKAVNDKVLNNTEDAADLDDDLIDLEALLNDDTYMPSVS
ncbi:hypothetical protein RHMOL_Rhmol10G0241900 [Rhododendron molle]|uniref:Uncharacterized protein n=1 Tax=Rhododendron molle TaxID=49168 RepID=A0ACC0M666_RHOML|nr:hypothetical protein RHMOL_Rhmol10G0241900 [Rhododendron molle]